MSWLSLWDRKQIPQCYAGRSVPASRRPRHGHGFWLRRRCPMVGTPMSMATMAAGVRGGYWAGSWFAGACSPKGTSRLTGIPWRASCPLAQPESALLGARAETGILLPLRCSTSQRPWYWPSRDDSRSMRRGNAVGGPLCSAVLHRSRVSVGYRSLRCQSAKWPERSPA